MKFKFHVYAPGKLGGATSGAKGCMGGGYRGMLLGSGDVAGTALKNHTTGSK